MGILNHSMVYLSGSMDYCPNGGVEWRKKITPELQRLGIGVLDPTNSPFLTHKEDSDFRQQIVNLKEQNCFETVKQKMKEVVGFDLRMVDYSTFIIAKVDPDITMTGTIWELSYAVQQHKPVLIFCNKGVKNIQNWLFGVLNYNYFFNSIEELIGFVRQINDEIVQVDRRKWKFLDFSKVYN